MSEVRVYCGCSVDGFIAGEDDDLSWLPAPADGDDGGFGDFLAEIGCILMGRRTYDLVTGMGPTAWMYGETPLRVTTHRPIDATRPSVRAVAGDIETLVTEAKKLAGPRDVYVDGGQLIRQTLDAGLVDRVTMTLVPMILGRGVPLFAGVAQRRSLGAPTVRALSGGMVQLDYRLVGRPAGDRAAAGR